jgi:hypothetical protein
MVFITEMAMSFIYEGMVDDDWPGGLAYLVVRAIKKKHMPDDTVSKVELRRQLNGINMKKGNDPAVLGTQIASIKVRFNKPGQTIDETEFIAAVIAQAPVIYTGVLTSEQLRHGNHLKLHHLFTAMDMQWCAMGGGGKQEANDDGEIALVEFQGVCFIYNKKGHRAHKCPSKKANGNGNGNNGKGNGYNRNGNGYNGKGIRGAARGNGPNCGHCGKPNHVEQQCWRKPGNEHIKPDWLKKKE